ncbi:hypothetical protein PAXRUDRAFT_171203, partial [Paxillus rubicundulus Ve08.2h10]
LDAKVVAICDHKVYTSPNVTFVPEPHMWQIAELQARLDGQFVFWLEQFGVVDFFQWPQPYCVEYEYTHLHSVTRRLSLA